MSDDIKNITTPIDDRFYKLVDRVPVPCSLAEFAEAMRDDANRVVAQAKVGDLQVSTVFTGIDSNYGQGEPTLFETIVFGLPDDLRPRWSFSTWDEAMEIQNLLVTFLTEHGPDPLLEDVRRKAANRDATQS
jgi:hypothetical protein